MIIIAEFNYSAKWRSLETSENEQACSLLTTKPVTNSAYIHVYIPQCFSSAFLLNRTKNIYRIKYLPIKTHLQHNHQGQIGTGKVILFGKSNAGFDFKI